MTKLTARLAQIRERANRATGGPWLEREDTDYYQGGTYLGVGGYAYKNGMKIQGNEYFERDVCRIESNDADKEFIAHSRTDVDYLLGLVERMREGLEWYAAWDWTDKYVQAVPKRAQTLLADLEAEAGK